MAKCLIVDDSATMRRIARRFLEALAFDCAEAVDGLDALEKLPGCAPDLILLDWEMPRLDGLETLRELRTRPEGRSPRVVMSTTLTDMERIVAALDAGADEYIMKPYDKDILADKLRGVGLLDG